jgi:hypothetical protein
MTPEIDKHLTASGRLKKRQVILNNFLGGLAWGFGTVVGATLVVAIVVSIAKALNIPFATDLVKQLQPAKTTQIIERIHDSTSSSKLDIQP